MKPKTFKKLALNKETVARLDSLEQQMAKGGTVATFTCFLTNFDNTCRCSAKKQAGEEVEICDIEG